MKNVFENVNLLDYKNHLKISQEGSITYIYDVIRKKNIVAKPEEMVRQLIIQFMLIENIFPKSRIAVEKKIVIDGLEKRFDILVFDKKGLPYFLVECKSFDVKLTEATARQIAIYNHKLKCPYLLVSNGKENFFREIEI